jgi:hypothetical protein
MEYRIVFDSHALGQKQPSAGTVLVIHEQTMTVPKRRSHIIHSSLLSEVIPENDGTVGGVAPVALVRGGSSFSNLIGRRGSVNGYGTPHRSRSRRHSEIRTRQLYRRKEPDQTHAVVAARARNTAHDGANVERTFTLIVLEEIMKSGETELNML